MDRLFYPERVAVIGVSERETNLGRIIAENLFYFGFHGEIFLVGRHGGVLFGHRILPTVQGLPEGIDVAIVLTPAPTVPSIVDQCGRKGIKRMVIETGGFREFSEEGAKLEDEILEKAHKWGIRFVGPNCIGIVNFENGLCCPFVNLRGFGSPPGSVSIIAQSGGVAFAYLHQLSGMNVRPNKIVSMGNKLDLTEIDYLQYFERDSNTEVVGLYLESIRQGKELIALTRRSSKTILLHKSNTGKASRKIAQFHTAALATDDRVVDAAVRQSGMVRVKSFRQFVHSVMIFTQPPMRGNNLVIISRSGGMAIIAADLAEAHRFNLVPFPEIFLKKVREVFRAKVINPTNPLDLGDLFDFDLYTKILEYTIKRRDVDGIMFQHDAISDPEKASSRRLIEAIIHLSAQYRKPIAFRYHTDDAELAAVRQQFAFPIFSEPEDAMEALAVSRDHYKNKYREIVPAPELLVDKTSVLHIMNNRKDFQIGNLNMDEGFKILEAYGIPVAPYQAVKTLDEAISAADKIGYPVAVKLMTKHPIHKTDMGALILNVDTQSSLANAIDTLSKTTVYREDGMGFLIQKMAKGGTEIILGTRRDPSFGAVIIVGLGGIFSEILKDTAIGIAPLALTDAMEMLGELRGHQLFEGYRGRPPLDQDALLNAILRLSRLMTDVPAIQQMDINPVMLFERGKGLQAVDVRIEGGEKGEV